MTGRISKIAMREKILFIVDIWQCSLKSTLRGII